MEKKKSNRLDHIKVRRKLKKPIKKSWFQKNLPILFIIVTILFLGQSMRGCINTSSLEREIEKNTYINDSISIKKNMDYLKLQDENQKLQDENQRLIYELKIAGVKVDESDKRSNSLENAIKDFRSNTIIEIKVDTTKNIIWNEK